MAFAVGFDVGACFCRAAVWRNGRVEVIPNAHGKRETPSVVSFTDEGYLVGEEAQKVAHRHPQQTAFGTKRLIGCNWKDPRINALMLPFVESCDTTRFKMMCQGNMLRLHSAEIASILLKHMKASVEQYLGSEILDVMVIVPVSFTEGQKAAMLVASKLAGFSKTHLISESAAAALSYCAHLPNEARRENVLVVSFGGGYISISTFVISNGSVRETVSKGACIGGQDVDATLLRAILQQWQPAQAVDARGRMRLLRDCEIAKRSLSSTSVTEIGIDELVAGVDFHQKISESDLRNICWFLYLQDQFCKLLQQCLAESKFGAKDIHRVVAQGACTRMCWVQEHIRKAFPNAYLAPGDCWGAAVCGAAIQMAFIRGQNDQMFYAQQTHSGPREDFGSLKLNAYFDLERVDMSSVEAGDVEWQFLCGQPPEQIWEPFPNDAVKAVKATFASFASNLQEGNNLMSLSIRKRKYTLNFSTMEQCNVSTGKTRRIRRHFRINPEADKEPLQTVTEELDAMKKEHGLLKKLYEQQLRISELWRRGPLGCFQHLRGCSTRSQGTADVAGDRPSRTT